MQEEHFPYSLVILYMSLLLPSLLLGDFTTIKMVAVHRSEFFGVICFIFFLTFLVTNLFGLILLGN